MGKTGTGGEIFGNGCCHLSWGDASFRTSKGADPSVVIRIAGVVESKGLDRQAMP